MAGGVGARMKSTTPKQFLKIDGVPVIIQTLRKFLEFDSSIELIVVLPKEHTQYWMALNESYPFIDSIKAVDGGKTRSDSVRAGLEIINEDGLVAIHDAVRPFVEIATIERSFTSAQDHGSGVAAVPLKDSIRERTEQGVSFARNRENYVMVQTPQTFRVEEIKKSYSQLEGESFSDDATVYEKAGFKVKIIDGDYSNIKITTPEDLE